MNTVREIINISYFDTKDTSIKEHWDMYLNIKNEILKILNKYDIKYVVADTEIVRDLIKENQQLKNNWNDLKKYLLGGISSNNVFITENSMLSKMQEIEKSDK